jgi:hypothetical protein
LHTWRRKVKIGRREVQVGGSEDLHDGKKDYCGTCCLPQIEVLEVENGRRSLRRR